MSEGKKMISEEKKKFETIKAKRLRERKKDLEDARIENLNRAMIDKEDELDELREEQRRNG